ncbi:ABC transporter permease [Skermanella stibiiresistens SB22]|uniref:ABC transporter permease n=1 Tax=Skermanella stibiiresistens SB22 TaxID=1385369 RepID=W9GR36_9PROT|nr:ABC transporter ATP-binding protein [Skermanella stibiiresistens]EWY36209.1 ABC transporter permease [Skermanella stibiiresistens SB22]
MTKTFDTKPFDRATTRHTATWPLLRRLIATYLRPYRWTLAQAVMWMALAAITTGAMAKLMEPIIDEVFQNRNQAMLFPVAAGVLTAFALRGISTYFHSVQMNQIGQRIVADVQSDMYAHLLRSDLSFFHGTSAGQLISRMVNDVGLMRLAVAECLTGLGKSVLTLVILVAVMFQQDWVMATGAFLAFPIASYFVASIGKRLRKVSANTQAELGHFSTILNQTLQGARHVKAYGMEAYERDRVGGIIENLYNLIHKGFKVSAMSGPITEVLSGLAIVSVIVYGGFQVINGTRTAGALFSFITAFLLAYEPMKRMAKLNGQLQGGLAAADRVFALLDTAPSIVDRPGAKALEVARHDIRFDRVEFSYGDDKQALHGISIEVPEGQTVALVGPSGAGKSTLLNLIPRFYDVTGGAVLIGGVDVRDATLSSLRNEIALVSQEVALFDDSIRANIAYGRLGASEDEIVAAAKGAAAHDFIIGLPDGYDTMVGEFGVKLSGGQRQRISIARAMLRNAPILLLDEATSALDTESERAVQGALRTLQHGRTTLVVAHRLSTIVDADRVYVIHDGRVAETGTHAELLRQDGIYARLWGMQSGSGQGGADLGGAELGEAEPAVTPRI